MITPSGKRYSSHIVDLHGQVVAHSRSRVHISQELAQLGRRCTQLAHDRFIRTEERLSRSMSRIHRLPQTRERTRARIHAALMRL